MTELVGNMPTRAVLLSLVHTKPEQIPPVILTGPWGTGKTTLAYWYAAAFYCAVDGVCGQCPSCEMVSNKTHPAIRTMQMRTADVDEVQGLAQASAVSLGGLPRVLVIEDIDAASVESVVSLAMVLDRLPNHVAVVMTSHDEADAALLTHAIPLDTRNLTMEEARNFCDSLTETPVPDEMLRKTQGAHRAVAMLAKRWNASQEVWNRPDYSEPLLRAVLTGNLKGGLAVIDEHLRDGGTYTEAVTGLLGLLTKLLEVRALGNVPPELADIAGLQTEPQALAILRVLWSESQMPYVDDPVVRLRTLFSVMTISAQPEKFTETPVTVDVEQSPHLQEDLAAADIAAFGDSFFEGVQADEH